MFGFVQPCGVCNYSALRRHVLTDDVLLKVGLSPEKYKSMRLFPLTVSERLLFELAITPNMLKTVGINSLVS